MASPSRDGFSDFDFEPMLVLCIYYAGPVPHPEKVLGVIPDAMRRLAFRRNRAQITVLTDRDDLPTTVGVYKTKYGQTDTVVQDGVRYLATQTEPLIGIEVRPEAMRLYDGFKLYPFALAFHNHPWEDVHIRAHYGYYSPPCLEAIVAVEHCVDPSAAGSVMLDFLEQAVLCGEVRHGVIDLDYWIANHGGGFYWGPRRVHFLAERRAALKAWEGLGPRGKDFARDPREGLILGPALLERYSATTVDALKDRLESDGVEVERLTFRSLKDGSVLILTSPAIWDMSRSIRKDPEVRRVADQLRRALIRGGIVAEGTVIPHVEHPVKTEGLFPED